MTGIFDPHSPTTAFEHDSTLVVALELSGKSWPAGSVVPGVARRPKRRLEPRAVPGLLKVIEAWKAEAARAGRPVARVVLTYEAGRDGFWIARCLREQGDRGPRHAPGERAGGTAEAAGEDRPHRSRHAAAHVSGLALRRAAGVLDGAGSERGGGRCAPPGPGARGPGARPDLGREPDRESSCLARDRRLQAAPEEGGPAYLVGGAAAFRSDGGVAPADGAAPVAQRADRRGGGGAGPGDIGRRSRPGGADDPAAHDPREVFSREFRNRQALAGFAGLTGTPFQSGGMAREQGISKNGNPRVRSILMQLVWRWLRFQPDSALAPWFEERTGGAKGRIRKIMAVALARKLLVALWRLVTDGVVPEGVRMHAV